MSDSKGFTWYGDGTNEETELRNVRSGKTNYPGKNVDPTRNKPTETPSGVGSSASGGTSSAGGASGAGGTGAV